jgi:hypothetical protein
MSAELVWKMCGPYGMDEDAGVVVAVVGVAADVRPLVADEDALAADVGEPLGQDAAGEAGADDEGVEAGPAGDGVAKCVVDRRAVLFQKALQVHTDPDRQPAPLFGNRYAMPAGRGGTGSSCACRRAA